MRNPSSTHCSRRHVATGVVRGIVVVLTLLLPLQAQPQANVVWGNLLQWLHELPVVSHAADTESTPECGGETALDWLWDGADPSTGDATCCRDDCADWWDAPGEWVDADAEPPRPRVPPPPPARDGHRR